MGRKWTLFSASFLYQNVRIANPFYTVHAFSPDNVWFGGNGVMRWNGVEFVVMNVPSSLWGPNYVLKIWGTSGSDVYLVGENGAAIHYDGNSWSKISTGTTLDLTDIYGAWDATLSTYEVLAVASKYLVNYEKKLFRLSGTTLTALSDSGIAWPISGIYFVAGKHYLAVGSGIYEKQALAEARWQAHVLDITQYHMFAVRGNGVNDLFVAGTLGEILHYNGSSWRSYFPETQVPSGNYYGVAVKGDLVFAAGENNPRAIVARGTRVR